MNLHRVDLISLSLFTRVARTGSISKGAELCHMAVGAANKRVSDLEAAVGVPLLERHSRGVTLTADYCAELEDLRIVEPPINIKPYAIKQFWHPRYHADPAICWLRQAVLELFGREEHTTPLRGATV